MFVHIPKTGGSAVRERLKVKTVGHTPIDFCESRNDCWTIVRNPFDRLISMYASNKGIVSSDPNKVKSWFNKQKRIPTILNRYVNLITPMHEFVNNEIEIIRFENLQEEMKGRYAVDLPLVNFSRRGPYQIYYDDELQEMVLDYYRKDFELFNYGTEL